MVIEYYKDSKLLGVAFHSEATYQDAYIIADNNMQKHGANNYYVWDKETYWNVIVNLKK